MPNIQIICPNCEQQVEANDINIASAIAKCSHCSHLFEISEQLKQFKQSSAAIEKKMLNMPMPEGLEVYEWRGELSIEKKWRHPLYIVPGLFAIPWIGFVIAWMMMAPFPMNLFGLLHGCIGVGFLYFALAGWFNVTHINVNNYSLNIQHKPLWWFGNQTISTSNIKQIYCQLKVHKTKNSESHTYDVFVMTQDDKSVKIVSQLMKKEQALYIEQEIERFLQIENIPVSGAIS